MIQYQMPDSILNYAESGMSEHGWCSKEKAIALASDVLELKPETCVEIGVYSGRSLIAISLALKENKRGLVIGVDPWKREESQKGFDSKDANNEWWGDLDHEHIYRECQNSVLKHGVSTFTYIFRGTSSLALKTVASKFNDIDLIHIDGNHSKESALFDVENWVPKVRQGGHVWFDDTDWETTKPAQSKLLEMCRTIGSVGTCGIYEKM